MIIEGSQFDILNQRRARLSRFLRGVVSQEQFTEWMQDEAFRTWVREDSTHIAHDGLNSIRALFGEPAVEITEDGPVLVVT